MKSRPGKRNGPRKPDHQAKTPDASTPISPGRRWLFRLVALVVLPLVLVVLAGAVLEIGLRLGGYGFDPHFFRTVRLDGKEYRLNNEQFTQRFFPPQLARWPDPFKIAANKPPDTLRIFIFGESAAMGDPQPAYGAGRYLAVLLRERFPQKKIEVINLGITAINSHVILPQARECAAQQGDFWIIYMGNNEMVGPFGAATVFGARSLPRWAVRLNVAFQQLRVGQWVVAGLRHLGGGTAKNASWGGMEMFLENQIAPGDPRKETVYRNFQGNLRDIVAAGTGSGAKVILNTVSVNLKDCPPFASATNSQLSAADRAQFDQYWAEGKALQAQSNYSAAAERFAAALKVQSNFAEAHFRLAQCELALTNPGAAADFQAACDLDALPFRADTRINQIIRQVAETKAGDQLVLADAEKTLAQAGGVTGDETFFEHVHFDFDGNYRLGRLWAEQVSQMLTAAGTAPATTNWVPEVACDDALGLSTWNQHFVLQAVMRRLVAPPLSTQFNNADRLRRVRTRDQLLLEQETQPTARERVRQGFAAALQRAPDDPYLYEGEANFFEAIKDPSAAIAAYCRLLDLRPDDFYALLQLGRMLGEQGQPEAAEPILKRSAELRPSLPDPWFELGNVLSAQSKLAPALDCMERASQLRPQDPSYLCYAGQVLGKLGRHTEAIDHYRRALRLDSHDWEAHFGLAGELVAANQLAAAIDEYRQVLKINPGHVISHINLGVVLVRFNRLDEAVHCFETALQLDPANQIARDYLASVRAHQGK
jgi:tetratricopeptide (TPR) repeat protein